MSVHETTIFQHLLTLLQTHHRSTFWASLNKDALSLCRNCTAFTLTSPANFVLVIGVFLFPPLLHCTVLLISGSSQGHWLSI